MNITLGKFYRNLNDDDVWQLVGCGVDDIEWSSSNWLITVRAPDGHVEHMSGDEFEEDFDEFVEDENCSEEFFDEDEGCHGTVGLMCDITPKTVRATLTAKESTAEAVISEKVTPVSAKISEDGSAIALPTEKTAVKRNSKDQIYW